MQLERSLKWVLPKAACADMEILLGFREQVRTLSQAGDAGQSLEELRLALLEEASDDGALGMLKTLLKRRHLPVSWAEDFILGAQMSQGPVRMQNEEELLVYAYHALGSFGLMVGAVLGEQNPQNLARVADLAVAAMLVKVACDVGQEARAGRVYLPQEWLREYQQSAEEILQGLSEADRLIWVMNRLLDLANEYFLTTQVRFKNLPWRTQLAMWIFRRLQLELSQTVRQQAGNPWRGSARLTVMASLRGLGLALWDSVRQRLLPSPNLESRCLESKALRLCLQSAQKLSVVTPPSPLPAPPI